MKFIQLWTLDEGRLVPDRDYAIDVQRGKSSYDKSDKARDPLFSFVNESVFERPTFKAFRSLLDNYNATLGNVYLDLGCTQRL